MSSASSVFSESSCPLALTHPIVLKKKALKESLKIKEELAIALEKEMKEFKAEIVEIEQQINSPTVARPDVARQCVWVGPKKTGKYRQLHVNELNQVYYLTEGTSRSPSKKTLINTDRAIYENAEVRLAGNSVWDGKFIARHLADQDENPEDLEESFGVEESFEEEDDDEEVSGGGSAKANPLNVDFTA
jgi:hypothetical protein